MTAPLLWIETAGSVFQMVTRVYSWWSISQKAFGEARAITCNAVCVISQQRKWVIRAKSVLFSKNPFRRRSSKPVLSRTVKISSEKSATLPRKAASGSAAPGRGHQGDAQQRQSKCPLLLHLGTADSEVGVHSAAVVNRKRAGAWRLAVNLPMSVVGLTSNYAVPACLSAALCNCQGYLPAPLLPTTFLLGLERPLRLVPLRASERKVHQGKD